MTSANFFFFFLSSLMKAAWHLQQKQQCSNAEMRMTRNTQCFDMWNKWQLDGVANYSFSLFLINAHSPAIKLHTQTHTRVHTNNIRYLYRPRGPPRALRAYKSPITPTVSSYRLPWNLTYGNKFANFKRKSTKWRTWNVFRWSSRRGGGGGLTPRPHRSPSQREAATRTKNPPKFLSNARASLFLAPKSFPRKFGSIPPEIFLLLLLLLLPNGMRSTSC